MRKLIFMNFNELKIMKELWKNYYVFGRLLRHTGMCFTVFQIFFNEFKYIGSVDNVKLSISINLLSKMFDWLLNILKIWLCYIMLKIMNKNVIVSKTSKRSSLKKVKCIWRSFLVILAFGLYPSQACARMEDGLFCSST
jgi:hypothetical protein